MTKEMLTDMVCGVEPNFSVFDHPLVSSCGSYNGSYGTWNWDGSKLKELTEPELTELYNVCKNSFK